MTKADRRKLTVFVLLAMPIATTLSAWLAGELSGRAAWGIGLVDFLGALLALAQQPPQLGPAKQKGTP